MIRPFPAVWVAVWLATPLWAQTDHAKPSRQTNWPRFLGETFDGVVRAVDPDIDLTLEPTLVWLLEVGEGYGIGTAVDDHYYHFDASEDLTTGQSSERLRCINLHSGREVWSQAQPLEYRDMLGYEHGPRSSPTIDGDRIMTMGVAGRLTCRNLSDGGLAWTVDTQKKYGVVQNFFGVGSSPLVLGDRVIVMIGGSPPEDQDVAPMRLDRVSPNGSAVVAFDRDTGQELWKCGDDLASYSSPRPIELDGETLVLVFGRDRLLAIDPDRGQVRWQFDHRASILESVNAIVPVVSGHHVFISECYEVGSALLKIDGKSSHLIWRDPPRDRRRQSMRCHWATPILVDGYLYGCSGRNAPDSDFRCIELMTGEVQWSDRRRIRSSITRVGDYLVLLEERGVVEVIRPNPARLEIVSRWELNQADGDRPAIRYPCWSAPVVVGTKLIVRGTDRVLCLDLAQASL